MNILLLGSGGREHALAWKMMQSPRLKQLFIAPGNAGTANVGTNLSVAADDFETLKKIVLEKQISMLVVGLLSKTLPQLNLMSVGFGINSMVMFAVFALSVGAGIWVFQERIVDVLEILFRGLHMDVDISDDWV